MRSIFGRMALWAFLALVVGVPFLLMTGRDKPTEWSADVWVVDPAERKRRHAAAVTDWRRRRS